MTMPTTNSIPPGFLHNLAPAELIRTARNMPLESFLTLQGHQPWLLVESSGDGELEVSLDRRQTLPTADLVKNAALGFHTVMRNPGMEVRAVDGQAVQNASELERRLATRRYFAIRVEKNANGSAYQERISIGRARNTDIVLRHASVSKFHAWFEIGNDGSLQLTDAGSKNGTQLAGRVLPARQLVKVNPGDVLCFGSVEAVLCAAETLWRLISRAG